MAIAVDAIDRRGPSNEMHHQLQPEKTKVRKAILAVYIAAKDVYLLFVANKTKCSSFKSTCGKC